MSQSSQFSITKCQISADRFGGFDRQFFDVKANVIDLNIYESLENLIYLELFQLLMIKVYMT